MILHSFHGAIQEFRLSDNLIHTFLVFDDEGNGSRRSFDYCGNLPCSARHRGRKRRWIGLIGRWILGWHAYEYVSRCVPYEGDNFIRIRAADLIQISDIQ